MNGNGKSGQDPKIVPELIRKNLAILENNLEPNYTVHFFQQVLDPLIRHYFRANLKGGEILPDPEQGEKPSIYISNESQSVFPWDTLVLLHLMLAEGRFDIRKAVHPAISEEIADLPYTNPFGMKGFWKRIGGIRDSQLNLESLMYDKQAQVLIYPENLKGRTKKFEDRYQLAQLSTDVIRLSIKYETDIIPIATINGEYLNPFVHNTDKMDSLARQFGFPFFQTGPLSFLMPVQPWLYFFALPAKLTYVIGNPIKPYEMVDRPYDSLTESELSLIRDQVKVLLQETINRGVEQYGDAPYNWQEFLLNSIFHKNDWASFLPFGWAANFLKHAKDYQRWNQELGVLLPWAEDPQPQNIQAEEDEKHNGLGKQVFDLFKTIVSHPEILIHYIPFGGIKAAAGS
jgi:1-acyl-sn-glycerol-3-phosphate acyltransferase